MTDTQQLPDDKHDLRMFIPRPYWTDMPLVELPTGEFETKWGTAKVKVFNSGTVTAEVEGIHKIYNVRYIIGATMYFDRAGESWRYTSAMRRVTEDGKPIRGNDSPTDKARNIGRDELDAKFNKWLEQNYQLLSEASRIEKENLILRAEHKLDNQQSRLDALRKYVRILKQELKENGRFESDDERKLRDVFNWAIR